jgi:hypothetical protein
MNNLFSLGPIYPSDFLKEGEKPRCEPVELNLVMDDDGLVHLGSTAPKEVMYGRYWYRSGTNISMRLALENVVESIVKVYDPPVSGISPVWLDIACNDGTLLRSVPSNYLKVGVDPVQGDIHQEACKQGHIIVQDYFSDQVFNGMPVKKADVITSIAMFYDVENPRQFIKDIDAVLNPGGLWVMQLSYTPLMLRQKAFDNICHEHLYYYNLTDLTKLLQREGFKVMDCQLNDVNGGSMRLYIMREGDDKHFFGSQPYRDVCQTRVLSLETLESEIPDLHIWKSFFYPAICTLKESVMNFIRNTKKEGKTIWGYGASTKGNTLLQWFGLDSTLITAIADRNPDKWGLYTVGTNIQILSEAAMRDDEPDYLLVLPWHFIDEFRDREKAFLDRGGKFIVPCPKFEIIGK